MFKFLLIFLLLIAAVMGISRLGMISLQDILCVFINSACGPVVRGSGKLKTETRAVNEFTQLNISGMGQLVFKQEATPTLTIEADDNLLPYIISEVQNDTLILRTKPDVQLRPKQSIKYIVSAPEIHAIHSAGGVQVEIPEMAVPSFNLTYAGSIEFKGTLVTDKLIVRGSGAGDVTVQGKATHQDLKFSGSSKYHALALDSETITISASGASDIRIKASRSITGSASGSSFVSAQAPSVDITTAGSSRVETKR
jgi:hypothetical protein